LQKTQNGGVVLVFFAVFLHMSLVSKITKHKAVSYTCPHEINLLYKSKRTLMKTAFILFLLLISLYGFAGPGNYVGCRKINDHSFLCPKSTSVIHAHQLVSSSPAFGKITPMPYSKKEAFPLKAKSMTILFYLLAAFDLHTVPLILIFLY
jgi:hypothetical protein